MDDLTLRLREALEREALHADTSPATVARVLPGPSSRTTRWWPLLGAAAALLLVVGVVTAITRGTSPAPEASQDPTTPPSPTSPTATAGTNAGWRTEVWQDVQVQVPSSWGWGGAPMPDFVPVGAPASADLIACGAAAFRSAAGKGILNGDASVPYVGRPVMQTDVCMTYDPGKPPAPTADYVWLGVPLEPGKVSIGGYVQETVRVGTTTVTVATDDPALRAQILGSARGQVSACPSTMGAPSETLRTEVAGDGMAVCAYARDGRGQPGRLVYVTGVDADARQAFTAAWLAAMSDSNVDCFLPRTNEWIVLATATQRYLVTFGPGCPIITRGGTRKLMVEDNTAPWAVDGIPSYVVGPYGGKGATGGFFRGVLG